MVESQISPYMLKYSKMITKGELLKYFREKVIHPVNFDDIVYQLNLSAKEKRPLKRLLKELSKSGEIIITRKGRFAPSQEMNLVTGFFESHKECYGFVIMDKPGERDIFIPSWATMGAMNNDRVVCRVENWQKREGCIIRILERVHKKIPGRFEKSRTGFYVKPKDKSFPFDIIIPRGKEDGAKDGDFVIAEIIEYPSIRKPPTAKIVKILEKIEDPKSEIEAIIDEFNLPRKFSQKVSEEAKNIINYHEKSLKNRVAKRKDLTSLKTITIDGEQAKDFDDAISIKIEKHGYTLFVHIADVGFYVGWDTAIDLEARQRGTSVYFPDRVIPMLPKELSEDICSLKPGIPRHVFTVEMDFDRDGNRINTKFYPATIISDERLTYTIVKKILVDNDVTLRKRYFNILQELETMAELSGLLRNKRLERGSLDFDLPEPEVILDLKGNLEAIIIAERNLAHIIIEEFMISANEAVAEYLERIGVPSIYRVHEEPDQTKLDQLIRFCKSILNIKTPIKSLNYSNLLKTIKGKKEEEIITYMLLRSLKLARYSTINVGHFGLASKCYTHFTSPIRRYPDLAVHRVLREFLYKGHTSERRLKELETKLEEIAHHSSYMERIAEKAEREVVDAMRVWFMKDKVGEEFDARIVNITPYGLKLRLKDFFVEGFLHVSFMTDDFYIFNEKSMELFGKHKKKRYRMGQELKVRIDKVDIEEREIIFDVCN